MSEQVLDTILVELKGISRRLDGIDQRLDGMDRRFDVIETTLNQVASAVMDTNERLSKVTDVQEEHAIALDSLQTEQSRQGKAIEALAFRVLEHDTEIRALKRAK